MPSIRNLGELDYEPMEDRAEFPDWPTIILRPSNWKQLKVNEKCPGINFLSPEQFNCLKGLALHSRESITRQDRISSFYSWLTRTAKKSDDCASTGASVERGNLIVVRGSSEVYRYTKDHTFDIDCLENWYSPDFVQLLFRLDESIGISWIDVSDYPDDQEKLNITLFDGFVIRKPVRFINSLARKMTRWWKEIQAVSS